MLHLYINSKYEIINLMKANNKCYFYEGAKLNQLALCNCGRYCHYNGDASKCWKMQPKKEDEKDVK